MVMSYTASMDISEIIRPEDLSKTDFFDFVTPTDMEIDRPPGNDNNNTLNQPLQGYDQFWGAEKDSSRLESAIFEDLNRYCWNPQSNNMGGGVNSNQPANTDGQIYTLTVLNGSEQWLKREPNENTNAPSLDLDTLLGNFPCYIKTEFPYDDSGFSTEHKEDIMTTNQTIVTNNISNTSLSSYSSSNNNNNNNDWHIPDHNNTEQDSPESLLRSALQGKGYAKGQLQLQLQNGIALLPPHSRDVKSDEELRRALFSTDQENLAFADSTLATPLFDDHTHTSCSPNPSTATTPSHITAGNVNLNNGVDDMFLTLDTAFTDDFEKIKRIASEVQQFCVTGESYPSVTVSIKPNEIVTTINPIVTTTTISTIPTPSSTPSIAATKTTKKYKRANSNSSSNNNNNNNILNNNNNNNNNNTTNNNNNNNNSPSQCNGQRKERALHYCSICSKGFKDKYSVNVHIRTHTGEKPFACSLCGKSFRQKAHLAKHYQTHLAQKNPSGVVKGSKHHNNNNSNNNNNNNTNINNNNNTNNNLNTTTNGGQTGPVVITR